MCKLGLVFRLSPVCSKFKLMLFAGIGCKGFHKWPPGCIMLNKRKEILNKCVHKRSFKLAQM